MSRIGKTPIKLSKDVEVKENQGLVKVSGPKGELDFRLPDKVSISVEDDFLQVSCADYETIPQAKADFGLTRSILQNLVTGVTEGYQIELRIQGVGYRAQASGNTVTLNLGFSNPVKYEVPEGITVTTPTNTQIFVQGIDKQLVGQTAATIRSYRPPDAYKGKGIRYVDEQVTLKEGKSVG